MGNMKPHTIKFTEEQWQIIAEVAKSQNVTTGQFIRDSVQYLLWSQGIEWPGNEKWGGARRAEKECSEN